MDDFVQNAEALFLAMILASAGENMHIDENSGKVYVNSPDDKDKGDA